MSYSTLTVNLQKIKDNADRLIQILGEKNIAVTAVTKSVFSNEIIVEKLMECGINTFADSRVRSLMKLKDLDIKKMLIRVPLISEIPDVIRYTDISLNSELEVIRKLNFQGEVQNKVHSIFLLIETGDLRDGELEENIEADVYEILKMKNIVLLGIASNMGCLSHINPTINTLDFLLKIRDNLKRKFDISVEISVGNSSFIHLIPQMDTQAHMSVRLGESIMLGTDTFNDTHIPNLHDDAFVLESEIIEIKNKFGRVRAILALGKLEVNTAGLVPIDSNVITSGSASDHTAIEFINNNCSYSLGEKVAFKIDYRTLVQLFSLEGVKKVFI